jgi:hypothetical protein
MVNNGLAAFSCIAGRGAARPSEPYRIYLPLTSLLLQSAPDLGEEVLMAVRETYVSSDDAPDASRWSRRASFLVWVLGSALGYTIIIAAIRVTWGALAQH